MKRTGLSGAVVLDAQGRLVASAGLSEEAARLLLDAPDAERQPLPGGGWLVSGPLDGDQAWPRFARAFVHEARSPLNALAIYLELLSGRLLAPEAAARPEAAPERILGKAGDQVRRVEELLKTFGELYAPRPELGIDLATIVRAGCRFAQHEAVRRGLALQTDICPTAPLALDGGLLADAVVATLGAAMRAPGETTVAVAVTCGSANEGPLFSVRLSPTGSEQVRAAELFGAAGRALARVGASVQVGERELLARFAPASERAAR